MLADALRHDGHTVRATADGLLALSWMAEGWVPDVALVDPLLPHQLSETVLWTLRHHPPLRQVRVVLVSGVEDLTVVSERERAAAVIVRPVNLADVVATVRRVGTQV